MTLDPYSWSVLSVGSGARGRQCYLLQHGIAPVRTGQFRIVWADDEGNTLAYWNGNVNDLTGGWSSDRYALLWTEDEARAELGRARLSFGDRRERRVEIVEMV